MKSFDAEVLVLKAIEVHVWISSCAETLLLLIRMGLFLFTCLCCVANLNELIYFILLFFFLLNRS